MPTEPLWAALRGADDQDDAELRAWWRQASNAAKAALWDDIQAMPDDSPVAVVIQRFAQYGYTRIALTERDRDAE